MTSEIVILITELRSKQRITLPAGSYRFGRSAQCEYVLRRNSVGDNQFTVSFENGRWVVTDDGSDYRTWFNNRYLDSGETSVLQSGDVIGLNTDGDADTQEITFRVEEITNVQGDGAAPIKEQTSDALHVGDFFHAEGNFLRVGRRRCPDKRTDLRRRPAGGGRPPQEAGAHRPRR